MQLQGCGSHGFDYLRPILVLQWFTLFIGRYLPPPYRNTIRGSRMMFARLNVSETVINSVPKLCRQFDLQQYIWKKQKSYDVRTCREKSTNRYFTATYIILQYNFCIILYNINKYIIYKYYIILYTL